MYYDIVESGKRIRNLRERLDMTRQELNEKELQFVRKTVESTIANIVLFK